MIKKVMKSYEKDNHFPIGFSTDSISGSLTENNITHCDSVSYKKGENRPKAKSTKYRTQILF